MGVEDMTENPTQTEGLEITEVEDGLVVYDPVQRRVHHLNTTAFLVFELSTGQNTLATITDVVQRVFGLDERPDAEVETVVAKMRAERLIR